MFSVVTPESVGVPSSKVKKFIEFLKERGLFMHSVLLARGDKIFCEAYYEPFKKEEIHRMYSVTKSYIGVAVCELMARGKLSMDDKIIDFFPDKLPDKVHPYLQAQTIRSMLKMQTSMILERSWFTNNNGDRLKFYFGEPPVRFPETGFSYDSDGSFVLGALVERVTGKRPLEYLREICLDEIGFSKEAKMLDSAGGYPWGDSALLCTPRDTLLFGRLLANGGVWNGKQLLNLEAVETALGNYSCTKSFGYQGFDTFGYGCQIWHSYKEGFAFLGMHDQRLFYDRKTDITFMCTGGNPSGVTGELLATLFYTVITDSAEDKSLPENAIAQKELSELIGTLKIPVAAGEEYSDFEKEINGKIFVPEKNNMGITKFSFSFEKDGGEFKYTNAQGDKSLKFGRKKNIIQQFPQTGYSKDVGGEECENHTYRCAVSGAWNESKHINLTVQIIDEYIGLLDISVGFNGKYAWLSMVKEAENFLEEYNGNAVAEMR